MSILLRDATRQDQTSIQSVVFTVLAEYHLQPDPDGKDADLFDLDMHYFGNGGCFIVLVDTSNDRIVGTAGITRANLSTCELRKMHLLKPYRGGGYGTLMLQHCLSRATILGYQRIVLETISPLVSAISLYRKFGFVEILPIEKNDRVDQAFELRLPVS